jgi:hypothetical protein
MATNLPTRLGSAVNTLYLICIITFVGGIVHNHIKLISHEFPLDYNEAGMLVITSTIAYGSNPYSLENQPSRISVYPVFYNILVTPFSRIFGNTLTLHRTVSGLFIVACCVLVFYLCLREGGTRSNSFVAAALTYAALLFYSTPIASPNGLGLFLFLATITIPWVNGFSTRSLLLSIFLGILAFYTKQYFIAGLGYVALYLFLAESKKQAIYFSLAALAIFTVILSVVLYTSPYFLEDTVFALQSVSKLVSSYENVGEQFKAFIQIYLPLLVILVTVTILTYSAKFADSGKFTRHSDDVKPVYLFDFDRALLHHKPNYIWFCCSCSTLIIALVLGKNPGNYLTYLFQLISPFLLVGIFALISGLPKWRWPFRILIVAALYNSYSMLPSDFSVKEKNWQRIRQEIAGAEDLYASILVLDEVMKKGRPVYHNGHTQYFPFGRTKPSFLIKTEPKETVEEVWEHYVEFIHSKIENREFDLLLIDNWASLPSSIRDSGIDNSAALRTHYKQTGHITLPLMKRQGGGNYRVRIYKPISVTPDPDQQSSR